MPLLNPGEFDDFPMSLQAEIQATVRQPHHDYKTMDYGKQKGPYMNGDFPWDPRAYEIVGYGTGDPKAPHYGAVTEGQTLDGGGPGTVETNPLDLGNVANNQAPRG